MVFAFVSMQIKNEKSCARIGIHKVLGRAMKPCKMADERSLIQTYFHLGHENEVILQFLVDYHGIKMSVSTLKRRLRDYGLKRRENEVHVDQLREHFHLGYENEVILQFLVDYHGIKMSVSTLKRRLRDYGLKRRENEVDVDQLRDIIRNEISGSGQALGCRAVWHSLRLMHRIHVPRHLVATILREIDPVGVQQRRRPQTLPEEIFQLWSKLLLAREW